MPEPTDRELALRAELRAIRVIVAALEPLDSAALQRTVRWLLGRYTAAEEGETK